MHLTAVYVLYTGERIRCFEIIMKHLTLMLSDFARAMLCK